MIKVLFLLKYRAAYTDEYNQQSYISSGLYNSARMVASALETFGINGEAVETKMVQLNSYNLIDGAVFQYDPDVVIIEAFWVPPFKVLELANLWRHRNRKWIIRNHSEMPFLAPEMKSISWIPEYLTGNPNIFIGSNSTTSFIDLQEVVAAANGWTIEQAQQRVVFFPNFYLIERDATWIAAPQTKQHLDVACFGAIRPLKNHVQQAVAALRWARVMGKPLRFHINGGRVEFGGAGILNSLRAMFSGAGDAELVEHAWLDHDHFLDLVASMDISMQVSFSETFNIVTADAVSLGVPVVVSHEIAWVDDAFKCLTTKANDIVQKMHRAHQAGQRGLQNVNLTNLQYFNQTAFSAIENTLDYVLYSA